MSLDPIALTQDLIRCPSVTPADAGALDVLRGAVEPIGFACHRLRFSADGTPDIDNLYARLGTGGRNFCFAGHTDVVPPGNPAGWTVDPFKAEIIDGHVYGRGAADMKGAIAAFAAAAARFVARRGRDFDGSISLLITGDEEGPAVNGTAKVLDWMQTRGERMDLCIVGEPTNEKQLGDMAKIGRRGSMNVVLTAIGEQGHVAYPHLAENPNHILVRMLAELTAKPLDEGTPYFQPSSLQVTTIDVGNPTTNLIPARATAGINIRFNDLHTSKSLTQWMRQRLDAVGGRYEFAVSVSGEAFLTPPGPLSDLVSSAVESVVKRKPQLSTTGGTSDARFIRAHAPVIEFGLVGLTMHKVDERAAIADVHNLSAIYEAALDRFFAA
ncbi:MAG TPA: succinyl-diaminopimelate desuccinylase [Alphaproteobacteria bacterium]|nr:succinyl-diaminopimelate desuccinylase [Alphaproteobacteria bacterium]